MTALYSPASERVCRARYGWPLLTRYITNWVCRYMKLHFNLNLVWFLVGSTNMPYMVTITPTQDHSDGFDPTRGWFVASRNSLHSALRTTISSLRQTIIRYYLEFVNSVVLTLIGTPNCTLSGRNGRLLWKCLSENVNLNQSFQTKYM